MIPITNTKVNIEKVIDNITTKGDVPVNSAILITVSDTNSISFLGHILSINYAILTVFAESSLENKQS